MNESWFLYSTKIGNGYDFLKKFSSVKISTFLIVWKRKCAHLYIKKTLCLKFVYKPVEYMSFALENKIYYI